MYSYLFGYYFYKKDIEKMIDEIEEKRKEIRTNGGVLSSSFAEELKNKLMGIEDTKIMNK